jgi:hypothetical protein
LPRVIACFRRQDYNDCYLFIVDDGSQYMEPGCVELYPGDNIGIASGMPRFPSLGAKRNWAAKHAEGAGFDAFLPCDDDDLFLPWHLSATAAALEKAEWSRPSVVLTPTQILDPTTGIVGEHPGVFEQHYTGHREDQTRERMYHPSWGIRIEAFNRVGGYPEDQSGPEDACLMRKMEAAGVTQADPITLGYRPSYVHCWTAGQSISSFLGPADPLGKAAWERMGKPLPPAKLEKWEPTFDLANPVILPGVLKRGF